MKFRLHTDIPDIGLHLAIGDEVAAIGSCFAQHVGLRMRQAGWPAGAVNPVGVQYNPASIATVLDLMLYAACSTDAVAESKRLIEPYVFERSMGGIWHSWLHDTHFSSSSKDTCLNAAACALANGALALRRARVLLITFGTSRAYRLLSGGFVVSNCHKEPARCFAEEELEVNDIVTQWRPLLRRLQQLNTGLHVVLTVSPFRYVKYGLHGNQLSKARLLLAVDQLVRNVPQCVYFPAYEIIMDELRDYRFYEADMVHPSAQAVDYVWDCFCERVMGERERTYMQQYTALRRMARHRSLRFDAEAAETLQDRIHVGWERLQADYHLPPGVLPPWADVAETAF